MTRRLIHVIFALCLAMAFSAFAATPRTLGLRALQTVTDISSPRSEFASAHVPLNFGASLKNTYSDDRKAMTGSKAISVNTRSYGVGEQSKVEIEAAAKVIMSPAMARTIGAQIKAEIAQGKVSSGVFIFEQQVRPRGVARDMKLTWSVTVTDGGQILAGDPMVVDGDPTIVYMIYTSSAVEAGLPANWARPDGGQLKWQLRRNDGTPTTPWVTYQTGGAFDASDADSEFKVRCLADGRTSGCPGGFTDARTLINDTSSALAMIDYVRKVAPLYDETPDTASGGVAYVPRMSISYDTREYDKTGCNSGSFRNIGRKGYTLETTVDRYRVPSGSSNPSLVNRYTGQSISPTQSFDVSKTIESSASALTNMVVDSFDANNLVSASSLVGLQYLAPITTGTTLDNSTLLRPIGVNAGDFYANWQPQGGNKFVLEMGGGSWKVWPGLFDRTFDFNLPNKDVFSEFKLSNVTFDDYQMIKINGNIIYVGPYGGDRLELLKVPYESCYYSDPDAYSGSVTCGTAYYDSVQYAPNGFHHPENNRVLNYATNIDIRPYLRSGQNTIFVRTIVWGWGMTYAKFDATSCLSDGN